MGNASCWQNDAGAMYGEIFAVQEHASMSSLFMNNFIILAIDQNTFDHDTVNTKLISTLKRMFIEADVSMMAGGITFSHLMQTWDVEECLTSWRSHFNVMKEGKGSLCYCCTPSYCDVPVAKYVCFRPFLKPRLSIRYWV